MGKHTHTGSCKSGSLMASGLIGMMLFTTGCSDRKGQASRSSPALPSQTHVLILQDTSSWPGTFGFGRVAQTDEISALDIDIGPDGTGLPAGSGDVLSGKALYAARCAACHGVTGTEGPNDALVGPASAHAPPFGQDPSRVKTIGNYWPYATTVFDYIRRAMPFNAPGSLSDDEVYSLTAFLLYANQVIDSTEVMDARTLPEVTMPANKLFVQDERKGGAEVR